MSATERCLAVPHLCTAIVRHADQPTLAALACVNRAAWEAATPVLYETYDFNAYLKARPGMGGEDETAQPNSRYDRYCESVRVLEVGTIAYEGRSFVRMIQLEAEELGLDDRQLDLVLYTYDHASPADDPEERLQDCSTAIFVDHLCRYFPRVEEIRFIHDAKQDEEDSRGGGYLSVSSRRMATLVHLGLGLTTGSVSHYGYVYHVSGRPERETVGEHRLTIDLLGALQGPITDTPRLKAHVQHLSPRVSTMTDIMILAKNLCCATPEQVLLLANNNDDVVWMAADILQILQECSSATFHRTMKVYKNTQKVRGALGELYVPLRRPLNREQLASLLSPEVLQYTPFNGLDLHSTRSIPVRYQDDEEYMRFDELLDHIAQLPDHIRHLWLTAITSGPDHYIARPVPHGRPKCQSLWIWFAGHPLKANNLNRAMTLSAYVQDSIEIGWICNQNAQADVWSFHDLRPLHKYAMYHSRERLLV